MDLSEVMRTAGAARQFTSEPVGDAVLHRILDHARFAPSGGNRQGWDVIVVRDPGIRTAVRDLCVLGWREYMAHVEQGLVPFAPTDDGRWTGPAVHLEAARAIERPAAFVDTLDTVPVMLIITARLDQLAVLDNGLDRQSIVGGGSIYPFVQNLVLAARNEGLGAAVTTFLVRQEPAARDLLHLPTGVAIASLVAMGHPVKQVTKLRRRPVEDFSHVDTYDGPPFTITG
ncbi:MAG: nitroreductase family protein [Acidimicrobiia bacterium]